MSFAESFWTLDYELGISVLFEQLRHGVVENDDFIQLFTKRMELELIYGSQLESIQALKSTGKQQDSDEYVSSIKNGLVKIKENFARQGEYHNLIASNIQLQVLEPFTKWSKEHKQRVNYSEATLADKQKAFRSAKSHLDKLQKRYFNKCRLMEEFKSHYSEEEIEAEIRDMEFSKSNVTVIEDLEEQTVYALGSYNYDEKSMRALLADILKSINLSAHKVPILGTYHNVTPGSTITQWLLDNMPQVNKNIVKAEEIGQAFLNHGFIRGIGTMSGGKSFINSSQYFYQWKPLAFELARVTQLMNNDGDPNKPLAKGPQFGDYFEDMKQAIGVGAVDFNDRSQLQKLIQEVDLLDSQYYQSTVDCDKLRCELEELIMDHLTFMQKCELDRLKALKRATFDFVACFSDEVDALKKVIDELNVLEETINPANDLKFLIENYSTGHFKPNVILYDNYYNSNIKQTFGVDLSVKSRLDHKVVPIFIQCVLSYLDHIYPDLENDEQRINLWIKPVLLTDVHQLRFKINDVADPAQINEELKKNDASVVTNLLKLYFLELPDSVIPYVCYDVIKSLYTNYPTNSKEKQVHESRINGLQNVLLELPKSHLATLDAIMTHLNRLIHIIGSKDETVAVDLRLKMSKEFGHLLLRPKHDGINVDSSKNDKHQPSLILDLFENKEAIFKELRRKNSSRAESSQAKSERSETSKKGSLETKLQRAVNKTKKKSETKSELPELPTTPKRSPAPSLKRSTSPNKKKLSTILNDSSPTSNREKPKKKKSEEQEITTKKSDSADPSDESKDENDVILVD